LLVIINATIASNVLFQELCDVEVSSVSNEVSSVYSASVPGLIIAIHMIFSGVGCHVITPPIFLPWGFYLFFIGISTVTQEHQDELKIRQSLLGGLFP
jgi:Flp pilus assembly protein protease CpaA